jgi:hypothetical protein
VERKNLALTTGARIRQRSVAQNVFAVQASKNALNQEIAQPPSPASSLVYARRPRRSRWQTFRQLMKYTALPILMVIGIKFAIIDSARLLLLYHQHKCLTYAPPSDQIAYTTIPSVLAEYSSKPGYLAVGGTAIRTRPTDWDWFAGHCLAAYPIPCRPNDAILFMHERTSPGGNRRLIVIERSGNIDEPL